MSGLSQKEQDIQMMLAAQCHLGTKNCDHQMERYVYRRRDDGIFVINLNKTWDKLQLAARVLVAIENPQDVVAMSARPYGQRAVLKMGQYTQIQPLAGRHIPGTFTNQIQKAYVEPRVLIVTDPRTDHQPIREAAYVNLPVIAFCDTDSPLTHVDIAIPANNKGKHSIGVLYYILSRMVLQMRGTLAYGAPWDVPVDLFFYREPEEAKPDEEEPADAGGAVPGADYSAGMAAGGFEAALPPAGGFEAAPDGPGGPTTYVQPTGYDAIAAGLESTPAAAAGGEYGQQQAAPAGEFGASY